MTDDLNARTRCVLFGDSHTGLYVDVPDLTPIHVGAVTIFRVGRDGPGLFPLDRPNVRDGDTLGFVFGEIDIRVHLAKQIAGGRDEAEVIAALVDRYLDTVVAIQRRFPRSRIAIFSTTPPASAAAIGHDERYPRNGSDEERARWARALNDRLATRGTYAGFTFVDQHSLFADDAGLLDPRFTSDGTHIDLAFASQIAVAPLFVSQPASMSLWRRALAVISRPFFG